MVRRSWLLLVIAPMVMLVLVACGGDNDAESAASDPEAVLADYEDARNAGDVDALVALYAEDAVVIGHPLDEADGTADVAELRALEGRVWAGGVTKYTQLQVDGNTVTFRQELSFPDGRCFAGDGQSVTFQLIRYQETHQFSPRRMLRLRCSRSMVCICHSS